MAGDAVVFNDDEPVLTPEAQAAYDAKVLARQEEAHLKYLAAKVEQLNKSLAAWPDQHGVRLALAGHLLKLFNVMQMKSENPFPLKMLRDTARTAGFASTEELQIWMRNNCGKRANLLVLADQLSRQSLATCPVQGNAYLSLLETDFLRDPHSELHQDLIDQAMLLRGNDPRVRFVAGHEAIMSQDWEGGLKLWDTVFHANQHFRMNILELTAPLTPVEFFLEKFQPNAAELKDLLTIYDVLQKERDATILLHALCEAIPTAAPAIEDDEERLQVMLEAASYARRLEDLDLAVKFLESTSKEFPLEFDPRYLLGMTLVELERPEEAMVHLQWCYDHDPGHAYVPKLIVRARKQMLKVEQLLVTDGGR